MYHTACSITAALEAPSSRHSITKTTGHSAARAHGQATWHQQHCIAHSGSHATDHLFSTSTLTDRAAVMQSIHCHPQRTGLVDDSAHQKHQTERKIHTRWYSMLANEDSWAPAPTRATGVQLACTKHTQRCSSRRLFYSLRPTHPHIRHHPHTTTALSKGQSPNMMPWLAAAAVSGPTQDESLPPLYVMTYVAKLAVVHRHQPFLVIRIVSSNRRCCTAPLPPLLL